MSSAQRQIVLIGLDGIGTSVFSTLPKNWHATVVDTDINRLAQIPDTLGDRNVQKICDNPSSRLVLKDCNLLPSTLLAVLTTSDEMNQEVVRIAREEFSVETIFVVQNTAHVECPYQNVTILNGDNLITNRLSSLLRGTISAANIGQERGEIRQITILNSSAARGKSLRELQPSDWIVAAIYRNAQLIVPHGDTIIRAGDEVVVVGEPETLDKEISFLQGGQILFPSQYGTRIGVLEGDTPSALIPTLVEKTEAVAQTPLQFSELNPDIKSTAQIRQYLRELDVGMIILPPKPISWMARWGFRRSKIMHLMFETQIPFWVHYQATQVKKILLCIAKTNSLNVLGTVAIDIARQFDAEITLLNIFPPNIDKDARADIEKIPTELQHLALSHGLNIQKIEAQGNPIREIENQIEHFDLIILGYSHHARSTIANPDISLHLFHQIRNHPNTSALFIPWHTTGR